MTKKEFKIGDVVIYNGVSYDSIKKGRKCEIVADKETPYNMLLTGDIYPGNHKDFLLGQIFNENDQKANIKFLPFVSVSKHDLLPSEEV
jgi:hypothetical protein